MSHIVNTRSKKNQMVWAALPRIILSLAHLKVAPPPPICQNPFPRQLSHHDESTGPACRSYR